MSARPIIFISYWSRAVLMPPRLQHADVGYRKVNAVSHIPPYLLANEGQYSQTYHEKAYGGTGEEEPMEDFEKDIAARSRPPGKVTPATREAKK